MDTLQNFFQYIKDLPLSVQIVIVLTALFGFSWMGGAIQIIFFFLFAYLAVVTLPLFLKIIFPLLLVGIIVKKSKFFAKK